MNNGDTIRINGSEELRIRSADITVELSLSGRNKGVVVKPITLGSVVTLGGVDFFIDHINLVDDETDNRLRLHATRFHPPFEA